MMRKIVTLVAGLAVAATTVVGVAGPAAATTVLPTPGTPVATEVTTTSVTISWAPSTGPVASYAVLKAGSNGLFAPLANTPDTTYTVGGLTPDTVVMFRIVAKAVTGSGFADSAVSGTLYVTTAPLPESEPPTTPGQPMALAVSTTFLTLSFRHSTDNMRVAGYVAQREIDGVWTDVVTNNITTLLVRDLTPGTTYTFAVVAFDPNGNRSPRSAPVTVTTRPLAAQPTCQARLIPFWNAYAMHVTVENMTEVAVENWYLTLTLPADHIVGNILKATITRDGDLATLRPTPLSNRLIPGGSAMVVLNASVPAGSPLPSDLVLNGTTPCSIT